MSGLGANSDEAIFVGDRVREDVAGPQRLGIPAVLTHEFRQEMPAEAVPLAVISELPELHNVLDALRGR